MRLAGWRKVAVAAAVLLMAACAEGGDGALGVPSATVATAPPQTTTTNPYAVPGVIDAAYVDRILAGLDAAVGDITREILATRAVHRNVIDQLAEIYLNRDLLNLVLRLYQQDIAGGFRSYKTEPGDPITTTVEIISADRSCVFGKVHRDASQISTNPDLRFSNQWIAIRTAEDLKAGTVNPTGWGYVYEGFEPDLGPPKTNPCDAA